jgi:coenzyme F420-reducing hydrogenase delta subunit
MEYPHNIRIIRVPCSGRIDPMFILRALQNGLDGVLVSGCHPGDCHYQSGNFHARRKFAVTRKLLEYVGIEPERVQFSWVAASEGPKMAQVVKEFVDGVRKVGPNRLFKDEIKDGE